MNAWNPSPGSRKGRFQHQTGCTQHAGLVSQSCRHDLDEVPGNQTGLVKGLLHTLLLALIIVLLVLLGDGCLRTRARRLVCVGLIGSASRLML